MKKNENIETVKLETLNNMAYRIAEYNIRVNGVYYCVINGKRVKVVK